MIRRCQLLAIVGLVAFASSGAAQGFAPKVNPPEALPAPKSKSAVMVIEPPELPRPGTRAMWQYYGIDRRGRFLPRVQYTPDVSFFSQNGLIFPWTTTQPQQYVPRTRE